MSRWFAAALALVASAAAGHATLVATTPADGERLQAPPSQIVLEFDEPVALLSLTLVDDRGERHAASARARVDARFVRLALADGLPDGGYVASYRIASTDSHVIAGAIAFSIGAHEVPERAQGWTSAPTMFGVALRVLQLAALLVTAGVATYVVLIGTLPHFARWITYGAAAAVLASIAVACHRAVMLAAEASGSGLSPWSYGIGPCMVALGAIGVVVALRRASRAHRGAALASAALMPGSLAISGHAAAATWPAAEVVLLLHVAGVAFWAGSLLALRSTLRTGEATAALRRFSRIAQVIVPVAIAAGVLFAALEVRSLESLFSSDYGRLVVAKFGVTTALLVLAAGNRFMLLPALERGSLGAGVRLNTSIAAEMVMVAVVIALGATLAMTSPPRQDAVEGVAESGALRARITASPAGVVDVHFDQRGAPVEPAQVWIQVRHDVASIGPLEREAARVGTGTFRARDVPLRIGGSWSIVIRARIDDFTQHEFQTVIALPASPAVRR